MQRERVTEDIFVFTSDLYVQVTAGVVITTAGAVVIDTLLYPEETRAIRHFVEERLGTVVKYVINTHFHADHTTGTCFFPRAQVIAHRLCRELLNTRGREGLESMKQASAEMRDVDLVLPNIVFDDEFTLHVGNKTFHMRHTPGHSMDSIVVHVQQDQVLFAADTLMPIPYFVDGSYDDFLTSLDSLRNLGFENIIQGHGEVILRGEVEDKIESDVQYLHTLSREVEQALTDTDAEQALAAIDIERCGKSRILLNGVAEQLHRNNVLALASLRRQQAKTPFAE